MFKAKLGKFGMKRRSARCCLFGISHRIDGTLQVCEGYKAEQGRLN